MKSCFKMVDKASAQLVSNPIINDGFRFGGHFIAEHIRDGKIIHMQKSKNLIPLEATKHLLDVLLYDASLNPQVTKWYVVVFSTDTSPVPTMTYAAPIYTEVDAKISNTYRPEYIDIHAASQSSNTASKAAFTFTGTGGTLTIYGAALVGVPGDDTASKTKGNTAAGGIILASSKFSSSRGVVDDDIINVTYVLSAGDDG